MTAGRTLADHLAARLDGLDLLRVEERERALTGRRPGQPGGLAAYLGERPAGVVQFEEPVPISSDGQLDVVWVPVACLASSEAAATALAQAVRLRLTGTTREPGDYTLALPDHARRLTDLGAWMCRPTFALTLLAGFIPE